MHTVSPASSARMMLKTATAPGICLASAIGFSRPSGWYPAESTRATPELDLDNTASIFMFLWPVRMPLKKYFPLTGDVKYPEEAKRNSSALQKWQTMYVFFQAQLQWEFPASFSSYLSTDEKLYLCLVFLKLKFCIYDGSFIPKITLPSKAQTVLLAVMIQTEGGLWFTGLKPWNKTLVISCLSSHSSAFSNLFPELQHKGRPILSDWCFGVFSSPGEQRKQEKHSVWGRLRLHCGNFLSSG